MLNTYAHVPTPAYACRLTSRSQHREGALYVNSMNVKYGGKQKTPRETESKIPSDPGEAAAYLGMHAATMAWQGKELDCKLKPGSTQHYYFRVHTPIQSFPIGPQR